jgi:hypothetical protein
MSSNAVIPTEIAIGMGDIRALGAECWRLGRLAQTADGATGAGLRYALRRLNEILRGTEVEVVDLSGRAYDPGMVAEVVEIRNDLDLPPGHSVVEETIAPTLTWRGTVISAGQIVVRRSAAPSPLSQEK